MTSPGEGVLWVTRSRPFNLLTAQRLRAMGFGVLTVPLFDVQPVGIGKVSQPDLIAFTSVNGVRHHPFRHDWTDLPVFAVGDATAAAARRQGYKDVRSADGNVHDLQSLILRSAVVGSRIVHFSAKEPAGDLAGFLSCRGFKAERVSVYETVPTSVAESEKVLGGRGAITGILVHSAKAGKRIADLITQSRWSGDVYCLSTACAEHLRKIAGVTVHCAPQPTERSLMTTIRPSPSTRLEAARTFCLERFRGAGRRSAVPQLSFANDNHEHHPAPA